MAPTRRRRPCDEGARSRVEGVGVGPAVSSRSVAAAICDTRLLVRRALDRRRRLLLRPRGAQAHDVLVDRAHLLAGTPGALPLHFAARRRERAAIRSAASSFWRRRLVPHPLAHVVDGKESRLDLRVLGLLVGGELLVLELADAVVLAVHFVEHVRGADDRLHAGDVALPARAARPAGPPSATTLSHPEAEAGSMPGNAVHGRSGGRTRRRRSKLKSSYSVGSRRSSALHRLDCTLHKLDHASRVAAVLVPPISVAPPDTRPSCHRS